jgi:hypothetical protein
VWRRHAPSRARRTGGHEIAESGGRHQPEGEGARNDPVIGEPQEDLTALLGNVPALVGQPVRGQVETSLDPDEQIQHDDLPSGPISLERLGGRREHGADPGHGVADRGDLLGEAGAVNLGWLRHTEQALGTAFLHGLEIEVLEDGLRLAPGKRRVIPLQEHAAVAEDAVGQGGGSTVQENQVDPTARRRLQPRRQASEGAPVAGGPGTELDRHIDVAGRPERAPPG